MSLMMYLLERNIRLSEWENYADEGIQATRGVSGTTFATMPTVPAMREKAFSASISS